MMERVGFEQASFHPKLTEWENKTCWLRSWVQLPPGPFLSVLEIRYYFELILGSCQIKLELHYNSMRLIITIIVAPPIHGHIFFLRAEGFY
jgi:hypothetical protein